MRLAIQFSQAIGHLRLELLCNVGRKDDLARSGVGAHLDLGDRISGYSNQLQKSLTRELEATATL